MNRFKQYLSRVKPVVIRIKNKPLLAGGIAAGLVVIVIVVVLLSGGSDPKQSASMKTKTAGSDQLAPKSEIKVGKYRYVSTCQAMPLPLIKSSFGAIRDDSYVVEDSLASSATASGGSKYASGISASCDYNLYSSTYTDVRLTADQAFTLPSGDLSLAFGNLDDAQPIIDSYKTIAAASTNNDAKAFAANLQSSIDKVKATADSDSDTPTISLDGIVVPGIDNKTFSFIKDNVTYNFSVQTNDDNYDQPLNADQLAATNKMIAGIVANIKKSNLSQAPVATVLGSADHFGPTKIIEPCGVLTTDIFNKAVKGKENKPVNRITPTYGFGSYSASDSAGYDLPTAQCTRNYVGANDERTQYKNAFKLAYAQSGTQASAYLAQYGGTLKLNKQPITTNADEAYRYTDGTDGKSNVYLFRVGSYTVYVTLLGGDTGDGSDTTVYSAPQDVVITEINSLVAQIKKQQ